MPGFRGRKVAASLKLSRLGARLLALLAIPRPKGRGLIEAPEPDAEERAVIRFRGRKVAASLKPVAVAHHRPVLLGFRGRKVAASLKLVIDDPRNP